MTKRELLVLLLVVLLIIVLPTVLGVMFGLRDRGKDCHTVYHRGNPAARGLDDYEERVCR